MSIIQKIQEKYAKVMAIIIAIALMTFVVMLAFENGGNIFQGGNSTTIGKVNGKTIEYTDFMKKVEQQEKNMEARGYGSGSALQQQAIDAVWNDEVNQILQNAELDKTGISVGKKEMGDVLYGPNAPEDLKKLFTDTLTGMYNGQLAKQQIDATIKLKNGNPDQLEQRDQLIAFINYQENARIKDKYNSLLANSINYPKWLIEKQIADNSQLAKITLVRDNYAANADSTIKVSDKEIEDYLNKHKKEYKQTESRSIAYLTFSTSPGAADTAAAKERVLGLKPEFDTVKNVQRFLAAQGVTTFSDLYFRGSTIQIPVKDSIFKLPVNGVYGPYPDAGSYTMAKLLGVRQEPEMVKVRHILISTATRDPQNPQQMIPTKDTTIARMLADSIQTAIRKGSKFDSLAKISDDNPTAESKNPGQFNKVKGGIYDSIRTGAMVPEFNDFIFGNPVGSKGVVKTDFGYHYIEILAHQGRTTSPAYKIAYLSKPIETSTETETNASNMAAEFRGVSRDQKSFDANAEKLLKEKGINKNVAADITPFSYQVGALGQSRSLVKNIYKAKIGEVLEPEKAGENWVVAIVTEVNEKGTLSLAKAKPRIEPLLRNKKIAEKLKQKIGNVTTPEAAAATLGGKQIETIDSLRMTGAQTSRPAMAIGSEPKVIGAAFNPANKGKVVTQVIDGSSGVYVVRVDNVTATAVADANVAEQRKTKYQQGKQQATYRTPIQSLRDAATIKDKRINFF